MLQPLHAGPAFRADEETPLEQDIRRVHRCAEHASRVVAQVEYEAGELAVPSENPDRVRKVAAGIFLKTRNAHIGVSGFQPTGANAFDIDSSPGQGNLEPAA